MHHSSFLKMKLFLQVYRPEMPESDGRVRLLEIGSKIHDGQSGFRELLGDEEFLYTGLDIEPGLNVDFVPERLYVWNELDDDSFDVCISSQTFEHNPYFWVTMCEISRVLRPDGLCCIIAPGGGGVHRYPFDCWRFYPDSWHALCHMAGLDVVEAHFETDRTAAGVVGGVWRDSSIIARKPRRDPEAAAAHARRMRAISAPFSEEQPAPVAQPQLTGPCFSRYEQEVEAGMSANPLRRFLGRRRFRKRSASIYNPGRQG